jgi:putative PIN family toxin of toxin-antitoxin system
MILRAVMDTNVVESGLRSQLGKSFELLRALRQGVWRAVVSNHLVHEYEEILKAHAAELGLSLQDIDDVLNVLCAMAEEWSLGLEWKPILHDPDDEPMVQLAFESGAKRIVTHNLRHLAPARALGIEVLRPRDFAAIIKLP